MKNDKYEPSTYFSNMTWTTEESFYRDQKNKAFWLDCGAKSNLNEKFDNRKNTGGYDVYSTDINTAKKIKEEVSKCIAKIHRILEDCPNNESDILQVFQYQFINFPMGID